MKDSTFWHAGQPQLPATNSLYPIHTMKVAMIFVFGLFLAFLTYDNRDWGNGSFLTAATLGKQAMKQ